MKKHVMLLVLILFSVFSAYGQLKEFVFVVQPNIQSDTKEKFLKYADELKRSSPESAEWFQGMAEGGHGSGFLYVDDDGENYIITNRHVVSLSDSADIIIETTTDRKVFKNCPIIYISDSIDIAILAFPDYEPVFDNGLSLTTEPINDGDVVISAGYPGVGIVKDYLWQFARGHVTNKQAKIDDFFEEEYQHLIQHSANVDHGNSGGPLLIELEEGYSVIGVNTYSLAAVGRENTFLSIPVTSLREELERAINIRHQRSDEYLIQGLERASRQLVTELNSVDSDPGRLYKMLSNQMVSDHGIPSLERIIQFKSDNEVDDWMQFFYSSPWDAMRYAVGNYEFEALKRRPPLRFVEVSPIDYGRYLDDPAVPVRAAFQNEKNTFAVTWVFENSKWRITDIDKLSSREVKAMAAASAGLYAYEEADKDEGDSNRYGDQAKKKALTFEEKNNYLFLTGGFALNSPLDSLPSGNVYGRSGFLVGIGYTRFLEKQPMYIGNSLSILFLSNKGVPLDSNSSSSYSKCGTYHLTVGYAYDFKTPLRFYAGGGLAISLSQNYEEILPEVRITERLGFGGVVETGILWNPVGMLTLGASLKGDIIRFAKNYGDANNLYMNLYGSLQIGLAW